MARHVTREILLHYRQSSQANVDALHRRPLPSYPPGQLHSWEAYLHCQTPGEGIFFCRRFFSWVISKVEARAMCIRRRRRLSRAAAIKPGGWRPLASGAARGHRSDHAVSAWTVAPST
jgi:hypothetical protein